MRIQELDVPNFKNLRDFGVAFDKSPHTMLVGTNGSGKSNLLESLVSLFSELHLEATVPFDYRVKYECGGNEVEIRGTEGSSPAFRVNGAALSRAAFYEKSEHGYSRYLPRFVFGYYSGRATGSTRTSSSTSGGSTENSKTRRPTPASSRSGRFSWQKRLTASSCYSRSTATTTRHLRVFLEENLGILDLESVLFVIKKPRLAEEGHKGQILGHSGHPPLIPGTAVRVRPCPYEAEEAAGCEFPGKAQVDRLLESVSGPGRLPETLRQLRSPPGLFQDS